jgi:hypothetical protein
MKCRKRGRGSEDSQSGEFMEAELGDIVREDRVEGKAWTHACI